MICTSAKFTSTDIWQENMKLNTVARVIFLSIVVLLLLCTTPVSSACSSKCPCVSNRAYCNGMYLTAIPGDFPAELIHLDFSDNKLGYLHKSILSKFRHLRALMLSGNGINTIQPGSFVNMRSLRGLHLSRNRLQLLTSEHLVGLYHVEMMSLAYNQLENIEGAFYHLRRLEVLNLKYNALNKITKTTFQTNTRLKYLDLSHNSISKIDQDAFKLLRKLRYLILNNNPLKKMEELSFISRRLQLVDFTNCQLRKIVRGLPKSVHDLRMEKNSIDSLKAGDFANTPRIKVLVLSNNNITHIHDLSLKQLRNVQELWLNGNKVNRLPHRLPPRLKSLFLHNNELDYIHDNTFRANHKLEMLYLQNNKIANITRRTFRGLRGLKNLDIDTNRIGKIASKAFLHMGKLQMLDLSKNPVMDFQHGCFRGLFKMIVLKLSHVNTPCHVPKDLLREANNLRFLDLDSSPNIAKEVVFNDIELGYLHRLNDLNLMHNGLYRLAQEFPTRLPDLKVIKLAGNPWSCDKLLIWLHQWMYNRTVDFYMRHEIRCHSPQELQNLQLKEVPTEILEFWDPLKGVLPPSAEPEPKPEPRRKKKRRHRKKGKRKRKQRNKSQNNIIKHA